MGRFRSALRSLLELPHRLGWRRFCLRVAGTLLLATVISLAFLWFTLPSLDDPGSLLADQSSVIVDRNGIELYRLYREEDRTNVPGDRISPLIKNAFIAIEDERFFEHGCIEVRSILRAIAARIFGWRVTGGASTITQQLARNALLSRERTVSRKIREIMLACALERAYSKERLLELYVNRIPFGQNAYGVEQASKRFFGKSASGLTLAQSAVLAGIPQRPTYFSPYGRNVRTTVSPKILEGMLAGRIRSLEEIPEREITIGLLGNTLGSGSNVISIGGRADQVLQNMQEQGLITEQERLKAAAELRTMTFTPSRETIRAAHFVLWIREQMEDLFADTTDKGILEHGGLRIETTLDWRLQEIAEKAVKSRARDTLRLFMAHNIALVAIEPSSREILAYVGNTDFTGSGHGAKVDMVISPRQPGSSFKPFVYATAFTKGYAPATILHDVQTKFGEDEPQNFDGTFWGPVSARRALGSSRNIPAVKAYFLAGEEDDILDTASSLGVTTPLRLRDEQRQTNPGFSYGWPLALGAAETPLLEMVQGYSTFATGGVYRPPASIRRITRKLPDGREILLYEEEMGEERRVLDPRIAYQITSILSDSSSRPGEFWQASLSVPGFQAAAKTGTSNKCLERTKKDDPKSPCKKRKPDNLWTIGYTPELAVGVWVGNATSAALSERADGLNVAAPIWKEFLTKALKTIGAQQTAFTEPPGLVHLQVSLLSGELPTECTPVELRKSDIFLKEHVPSEPDPACMKLTVDKVTGLLASGSCPAEAREERSFFKSLSVLSDRFPQWQRAAEEWAAKAGSGSPLPVAPTEECDITLTPGRLEKPRVSILFPQSNGEVPYPSFVPRIEVKSASLVTEVAFTIDGKSVGKESGAPATPGTDASASVTQSNLSSLRGKFILRIPKSLEKKGIHTLEVTVTDSYFNQAKDSVTFRFGEDSGAPVVSFIEPREGTVVKNGTGLVLEAEASDSEGAIKYVEFYLDDLLLSRKPREPYRLTYPLIVTPGVHRVRAVATDLSGQTDEDVREIVVE